MHFKKSPKRRTLSKNGFSGLPKTPQVVAFPKPYYLQYRIEICVSRGRGALLFCVQNVELLHDSGKSASKRESVANFNENAQNVELSQILLFNFDENMTQYRPQSCTKLIWPKHRTIDEILGLAPKRRTIADFGHTQNRVQNVKLSQNPALRGFNSAHTGPNCGS